MANPGEATFKSNVLSRDEKGGFGIPMKRVIAAFMVSAIVYTVSRTFLGNFGIVLGLISALATVVLTSPRGGLPYWQRILHRLRASLIVAQIDQPESLPASLGKSLELRRESLLLDGERLFKASEAAAVQEESWAEWRTYAEADAAKTGDGLVIVDGPRAVLKLAERAS